MHISYSGPTDFIIMVTAVYPWRGTLSFKSFFLVSSQNIYIYIYYYITFSYHGNLYYIKLYWWRVTEWLCITHFTWCYRNKHTLHKKTYIKSSFHCHLNYACVEQSSNGSVWLATRLRRSYWTATNEQHSIWLVEAALALLTTQWVCLLLLPYDEMENVK